MIVRAVIEWDELTQAYSATCPELNFVSSFGDTKEEAMQRVVGVPPIVATASRSDRQFRRCYKIDA